jgi:hypothetical protein
MAKFDFDLNNTPFLIKQKKEEIQLNKYMVITDIQNDNPIFNAQTLLIKDQISGFDKYIKNMQVYPTEKNVIVSWEYIKALEAGNLLWLELYFGNTDNMILRFDVTGQRYLQIPRNLTYNEQYELSVRLRILVETETPNVYNEMPGIYIPVVNTEDLLHDYAIDTIKQLFMKYQGVNVNIFTVKYGGAKCPRCFNHALRKASDPYCPECFGTGYQGGYNKPIFTQAFLVSLPQKQKNNNPFIQFNKSWYLLLPADIILSPEDLIYVNSLGLFLKVSEVSPIRLGVVPVAYKLVCTEVPNPNLLEKFKINPERESHNFAPRL